MAYKIEKVKLPGKMLDRRVKLLDCQRERIFQMYNQEGRSIRALSVVFHVSKRLIRFISVPESQERAQELFKKRQKEGRYSNAKKNYKSREETREYKANLFKEFGL